MMEERIRRACAWIEDHLDSDFAADEPARAAGISDYHFRRHFTALTGISPGKYIRRRRLGRAAQKLLETGTGILDIALDARFTSHEAFTRAFEKNFGRSPKAFRQEPGAYEHLLQPVLDADMLDHLFGRHVSLTPELRQFEGRLVAGPGMDYNFGVDPLEINRLWRSFIPRQAELNPEIRPGAAYGVNYAGTLSGSGFRHIAALPVTKTQTVPPDMETFHLPEGTYAVFTHTGRLADFPKTVTHIWGTALTKSGLEPAADLDFELYDERFDAETLEGAIEVWIPVRI